MPKVFPHQTEIRVRYSETDKMGRAYHSHYLVWFDIARTKFLEDKGFSYAKLEEKGIFLVVVEANCKYIGPAKFDDLVIINTSISNVGKASIEFIYEAKRKQTDKLLATGYTKLACLNKNEKPMAIPDKIRSSLKL